MVMNVGKKFYLLLLEELMKLGRSFADTLYMVKLRYETKPSSPWMVMW